METRFVYLFEIIDLFAGLQNIEDLSESQVIETIRNLLKKELISQNLKLSFLGFLYVMNKCVDQKITPSSSSNSNKGSLENSSTDKSIWDLKGCKSAMMEIIQYDGGKQEKCELLREIPNSMEFMNCPWRFSGTAFNIMKNSVAYSQRLDLELESFSSTIPIQARYEYIILQTKLFIFLVEKDGKRVQWIRKSNKASGMRYVSLTKDQRVQNCIVVEESDNTENILFEMKSMGFHNASQYLIPVSDIVDPSVRSTKINLGKQGEQKALSFTTSCYPNLSPQKNTVHIISSTNKKIFEYTLEKCTRQFVMTNSFLLPFHSSIGNSSGPVSNDYGRSIYFNTDHILRAEIVTERKVDDGHRMKLVIVGGPLLSVSIEDKQKYLPPPPELIIEFERESKYLSKGLVSFVKSGVISQVFSYPKSTSIFVICVDKFTDYCLAVFKNGKLFFAQQHADVRYKSIVNRACKVSNELMIKWDDALKCIVLWKVDSHDSTEGPFARSLSVTMYTFKPDV